MKKFLLLTILATSGLAAFAQSNTAPANPPTFEQQARAYEQATEKIRADCVQDRRTICGKIVKVLDDGLVVDSGYASLLRPPLDKSWLVPGTVQAERDPNLREAVQPGTPCVGLVYLTALPKSRTAKPKLYDYVVLTGYPAGEFTYTSVGTIQRTVRRFSASLPTAIKLNRDQAGLKPPVARPGGR